MKEAIEYYYAGTINAAILAIFNETGAKITEAKKAEDEIVDAKYELQKTK